MAKDYGSYHPDRPGSYELPNEVLDEVRRDRLTMAWNEGVNLDPETGAVIEPKRIATELTPEYYEEYMRSLGRIAQ